TVQCHGYARQDQSPTLHRVDQRRVRPKRIALLLDVSRVETRTGVYSSVLVLSEVLQHHRDSGERPIANSLLRPLARLLDIEEFGQYGVDLRIDLFDSPDHVVNEFER